MSFPVSKSRLKQWKKTRGGQIKAVRPQITSLCDVLTVLLIYMIQSFSAEGHIVTPAKDMQLPLSSALKSPQLTVQVSVNSQFIMVDDKIIANVEDVLTSEELVIPGLYDWLGVQREQTQKIEKYSDKTKFTGDVTIMGDKRIRFGLLKKIMYTCGQQGFNNFKLAVEQKG